MRIAPVSIVALAALLAAACGQNLQTAEPTPEELGMDDPDAPGEPDPQRNAVTFEPMSNTAQAFTGAITLEALPRVGPNAPPRMKLTGANGLTYVTELAPGMEQEGVDWSVLFGAPIDVTSRNNITSVDIHFVDEETAPASAVNGGFCGRTPTYAIAMATPIEGAGGSYVGIAAFSGQQWPPADETALCGIYNYLPPR